VDCYHIRGGSKLQGEHRVSGAKNAVLPILAATIIPCGESVIRNCPHLSDVEMMIRILEELGCKVKREGSDITINSEGICTSIIPEELMRAMRSSVFLMGPMLARWGLVNISYPGGCEIGCRPIDIHLSALRRLGVRIVERGGFLECSADKMRGCTIHLDFPSVGATENIMMAAVGAVGETHIINPAKEPEIRDLQNYLNSCGARIKGAGTDEICVKGIDLKLLHGAEYKAMPDRIEAGTLLIAAAITGGELLIRDIEGEHLSILLSKMEEAGCIIRREDNQVYVKGPERISSISPVKTLPYPGFPTDMQSQLLTLMTLGKGTTVVTETIFENRFKYVDELVRMGAKIHVEGRTAIVTGVDKLMGARVESKDLRGGASLVIAGLAAEGDTYVEKVCHIDRGYDKFEETLGRLGACITRVKG
jgi:UDP-N-acetylglucosamine 1-carboxyvinyltransferase